MSPGRLPFEFGYYLSGKQQSQITATEIAMQQRALNQQLVQIHQRIVHLIISLILRLERH